MKYKRLTTEDLKGLEPEFINFLAAAQITAKDWVKMKENEFKKAEELVDVFSDMVYDKVLKKIKMLEFRDEKTINIFNCLEDKMQLIGLKASELSGIDFTKKNAFANWDETKMQQIEIVHSEKKYSKERELELFDLLQSGCFITDEKLYNILSGFIK